MSTTTTSAPYSQASEEMVIFDDGSTMWKTKRQPNFKPAYPMRGQIFLDDHMQKLVKERLDHILVRQIRDYFNGSVEMVLTVCKGGSILQWFPRD